MGSEVDQKRRTFLKGLLGLSILTAIAGTGAISAYIGTSPPGTKLQYPKVKIANISELKSLQDKGLPAVIPFCYPLTSEPNLLIKVGSPVKDGVGPDQDIVAFSRVCQHLGCTIACLPNYPSDKCNGGYYLEIGPPYLPTKYSKVMFCPCHGSIYDITDDAKVLGGPAPRPLPRVILEYDNTTVDIYAVGMEGPVILGRGPPGLTGTNLTENLIPGMFGGTLVNENTIRSC